MDVGLFTSDVSGVFSHLLALFSHLLTITAKWGGGPDIPSFF